MVLSAVFHVLFHQGDAEAKATEQECSTEVSMTTQVVRDDDPIGPRNLQVQTLTSTPTVSVEGIELPGVRLLEDGTPLYRNGHGIRSISFFGMDIKVYVAHLYTHKPLKNEEQAMLLHHADGDEDTITSTSNHHNNTSTKENPNHHPHGNNQHHHHHNPMQLDFTFLRHVGQSRVVSAWTQQLEHSVTFRYDGYEHDRDTFIELFSTGPIASGGTQTVQLVGEETRIIDQGQTKGIIRGKDFQRSFLSMWFGHKAVAEDLKRNLLQGHDGVVPCHHGHRHQVDGSNQMMEQSHQQAEPVRVGA